MVTVLAQIVPPVHIHAVTIPPARILLAPAATAPPLPLVLSKIVLLVAMMVINVSIATMTTT